MEDEVTIKCEPAWGKEEEAVGYEGIKEPDFVSCTEPKMELFEQDELMNDAVTSVLNIKEEVDMLEESGNEVKSELEVEDHSISEHSYEKKAAQRGRPRIHPPHQRPTAIGRGVTWIQVKEMIWSATEFFEEEADSIQQTSFPVIPFTRVQERTAAALKVSKNTVRRITREKFTCMESGKSKLSTPGKKRLRNPTITSLNCFQEHAIRQLVYECYSRKEQPTMKGLLISLKLTNSFPGSHSSLYSVLRDMGFECKKINRRKLLLEKADVVISRCSFLEKLKTKSLLDIVWLGETWINIGPSVTKGCSLQGKTGNFLLLHAGTAQGFVNDAVLLSKSRHMGDYHEEMDQDTFHKWFREQLLPNIKEHSVIVMDNVSWHSAQIDRAPTNVCRKDEMLDWLVRRGVQVDCTMSRGILLGLINENKPRMPLYVVDELARKHGHEVVRLPPYHGHFNPIELLWDKLKAYVAKRNKTFTPTQVEQLIADGLSEVDAKDWKKSVLYIWKELERTEERERSLDSAVDELIKVLQNSSSTQSVCDSETSTEEESEDI